MLIKARQWIRETFAVGSRPSLKKVEEWVAGGDVPGMYMGDELFISDSFGTHRPIDVKPAAGLDLLK